MSSRRRIAVTHILTRPELGGAQDNTLYTVTHLDRGRFEPSLITSPDGPLAADMAEIPDAAVTFIPELAREIRPAADWRALRALIGVLRRQRPDIVHTHSSKAGILGRWAARRAGVRRVVHSVHGFPFHDHQSPVMRGLYASLERGAARLTDRFICVSRADIEKARRHRIFPPGRAVLIRSGVRLEEIRAGRGSGAELRAELGIAPEEPLAGMVACLKPQKDPLSFVRIAAGVLAALPAARFLLVGDGELRPRLEAEIKARRLGGRLILCGWRRDIPAVMDALDVLVLTSLHEGLPRVVPEAMAAGRPVVATAVDGTPEAVEDGVTGFLFTPGDEAAAAGRIVALLADPGAARRMGAEGERRVDEFDIDTMVRLQEALYEDLLGMRAGEAA
jgi:glycosyltransferase involved in cell wall biosynthesis